MNLVSTTGRVPSPKEQGKREEALGALKTVQEEWRMHHIAAN